MRPASLPRLWRYINLLLTYKADRDKSSFVIFDIRELWRSARASECPDVKN